MDRNTITGFILLALMSVGFFVYSSREQQKAAKERAAIETIANAGKAEAIAPVDSTEIRKQAVINSLGSFANLATGEAQKITVETDDAVYTFDSKGGTISSVQLRDFKTYDKQPLELFNSEKNKLGLSFVTNENKSINTGELFFTTTAVSSKISGDEQLKLEYVLNFGEGQQYIHEYVISGKGYLLDFNVRMKGIGGVMSNISKALKLDWSQNMPSLEKNLSEERQYSNVYYRTADKNVDELSARSEDDKVLEQPVQWVSFKQKFFNNTLIARDGNFEAGGRLRVKPNSEEKDVVKYARATLSIPVENADDFSYSMQWYFGPNKYNDLKKLKIDLDEIIPLGWAIFGWVNKFLIIPVFDILGKFISNYGVIILILTVLLKLVLTPLNRKQLISSVKMQILKPEIDQLKKKYGDDKQMIGAKQMEIFRNAGVNPMGGCLPMLLQMPILFAMYRFFPNSIELRQQSFLWADDLSHYDSILNLPFSIPLYGDHVSLFTLLMAITSFAYTRMSMAQQQTGMADDMMAMQMKIMQYLTPVMFLVMFNSFSAALSYYYFLFNLLSIIQTFVIKKFFIDENALRAEIEFNKKQPKKKSAWQERVEQMMEQQKTLKEQQQKTKK